MNNKDYLHVRIFTAIAAMLLLLTACRNDPDPTGIDLIPDSDLIGAARFDSQSDSASMRTSQYAHVAPHGSSTLLSIGEADAYNARALLRWLLIPGDTVAYGGRIISAFIRLHTVPYHVGDISAVMRIEAREIMSFWNSFTITTDSLPGLERSTVPVGVYEQDLPESGSIDIPLDSVLIRTWLVNSIEGRYTENRGVLLEAPGSAAIRAFHSLDATAGERPALIVVMETSGGIDTIRGESADDTWLVTRPEEQASGRIILHSGVSVRGRLFFDVSAIPAASIVNHAELRLTKDTELSTRYYRAADSVLVYENLDSTQQTPSSSGLITRTDSEQPAVLITEGAALTRAVQNWVNRKWNHGLILLPMNENTDLDRLAIFGADSDAEKRPRLIVTYTTQP
ncbi:MAG: hypothetical protein KFH87_08325 [Bacteroidetes bacterium]|nr:hypothetical protein [Bacteroidota bacterium]